MCQSSSVVEVELDEVDELEVEELLEDVVELLLEEVDELLLEDVEVLVEPPGSVGDEEPPPHATRSATVSAAAPSARGRSNGLLEVVGIVDLLEYSAGLGLEARVGAASGSFTVARRPIAIDRCSRHRECQPLDRPRRSGRRVRAARGADDQYSTILSSRSTQPASPASSLYWSCRMPPVGSSLVSPGR